MQNSPVPSNDLNSAPPPPPPPFQPGPQLYVPRAAAPPPTQHRSVTVQMSPRNLIIGGSVLAFLVIVLAAFAIFHTSSTPRTSQNPYMNDSSFPSANTDTGNTTTTTDSNGNSVTMGPGAHSTQNADGSTTTTDSNGNTVTQGGSGNSNAGFPEPQQNPSQNDNNFPQQQQNGGFPQQQQGYPQQQQQDGTDSQQQQGYPQQQQGYPQQQRGYNPQQGYPR